MVIRSNGSKWAGQQPDSIATLIGVLENPNYALDPTFELYGRFIKTDKIDGAPVCVSAFGNFWNLSHVFNIRGTKEEMQPLAKAIQKHRTTARYKEAVVKFFGSPEGLKKARKENNQRGREREKLEKKIQKQRNRRDV